MFAKVHRLASGHSGCFGQSRACDVARFPSLSYGKLMSKRNRRCRQRIPCGDSEHSADTCHLFGTGAWYTSQGGPGLWVPVQPQTPQHCHHQGTVHRHRGWGPHLPVLRRSLPVSLVPAMLSKLMSTLDPVLDKRESSCYSVKDSDIQ